MKTLVTRTRHGNLRSKLFAGCLGVVALFATAPATVAQTQPPIILGISYFSGLGASNATISRDFAALKANGFQLVRVWGLWSGDYGHGDPGLRVELFNKQGVITTDQALLNKLNYLIQTAAANNLLVDLTFPRHHCFGGTTWPCDSGPNRATDADYNKGLREVGKKVASYTNLVIMDAANEANKHGVTETQARDMRTAARTFAPALSVSVSIGIASVSDVSAKLAPFVTTGNLDFADIHCCGNSAASLTNQVASAAKSNPCCSNKAIYFSETGRCKYSDITSGQITCSDSEPIYSDALYKIGDSALGCRTAGCAAWVFHTGAAFLLRDNGTQTPVHGSMAPCKKTVAGQPTQIRSSFRYQLEKVIFCYLPNYVNGFQPAQGCQFDTPVSQLPTCG